MGKYIGKAWVFKDNIDTDEIIPGPYLTISDPKEMGKHCMEGIDPQFAAKVSAGDILVAGNNFGCGSSREQAPLAIKASGVAAVVAVSFSRLFYRNAINIGLPIFESAEASIIREGDLLEIDPELGYISNLSLERSFQSKSFPPFIQDLIKAGGVIGYINQREEKLKNH